jgi:hypothetical protein
VKKLLSLVAFASLAVACNGGSTNNNPELAGGPAGTAGTADTAATGAAPAAAPAPVVPRYREITVPAGTTLRLELQSAVGSDSSKVEDAVRASLRAPVSIDGQTVLPAGTEVVGAVTNVERSGRVRGRARVAYRFNQMTLDSERYDIQTSTVSHLAEATKGEDATKIGIGAGAGAAIGALLGGGDGAAKGAAIGGAGGTGVVLATRGKEVRLGPGADVSARLTAPLTVRVKIG